MVSPTSGTGSFPSGQRGQTVNLLAKPSKVRILHSPDKNPSYRGVLHGKRDFFFPFVVSLQAMEKRFFCTQCGICCRYEEGYVFLSPQDLEQLTAFLGQKEARIVEEYCRWVPLGGEDQLSLREQPNHDCVFWRDGGCIVYEARPLQCRTYPLWRHILEEPRGWEQEALSCPGIGIGEKVSFLAEKRALRERQRQGPITRPRSGPGRK